VWCRISPPRDATPGASLAFATTGIGFGIQGVPLAEDSALIDVGGDSVTDNGVKSRFSWLF
jgi:uncharacterized protein with beta-barrel porin domain